MKRHVLITKRACVIARKLGITLEEAQKMKAEALNPPRYVKKVTKIEESDNV